MAESMTTTKQTHKSVRRYQYDWVSAAGGTVTQTLDHINGMLVAVQFIPDGAAAPTNLYDVVITDQSGEDVLQGEGANLLTATSAWLVPVLQNTIAGVGTALVPLDGPLSLAITNAGNTKEGIIILWVG